MVKKFFKASIGPPGLFSCVKTLKIRREIFPYTRAGSGRLACQGVKRIHGDTFDMAIRFMR